MSQLLARIVKTASVLALLAACGANDSGTNKGPRGNNSADDGSDDPSNGTGGEGGGGDDWVDQPGSDSGTDPDAGCAKTSVESNALPTSVVFQLDTSGSMNCLPTETEAQCDAKAKPGSRWEILKGALKDAFPSIPSQTVMGLMRYPGSTFLPAPICQGVSDLLVSPAALDSTQTSKLGTALDKITPKDGTPTHDAMAAALGELQKLPAGNKYIVLATDGAATYCLGCNPICNKEADNDLMIKSVGDVAQQHNIRTFVIGVPGSEPFRSVLSRMAKAGGTAKAGCGNDDCHYDMTTSAANFGEAIAKVLGEISQQLLGCTYSIPSQDGSFDPGKVNVQLTDNGATTDIYRDKSHQDGWDYSQDGKSIELYGAACEKTKATKQGRIDIIFGCPTQVR